MSKPIDYINRAKELSHTTYFTTEHGWQGNIFEALTLCKENDLECIYGVEAYYVDDRFNKEDRKNSHIILIALTNKARREINNIISKANTEGFYYKPRIDRELLLSLTPTDTIITTACVVGRLFKDEYEEEFLKPIHNHFKDNLYLEVQSHNHISQINHNKQILNLSKKYGIKLIHANDSHYIKPEDSKYRDLFLKAKGIIYEEESGFILDYPTYDEIVERYRKQRVLNDKQIEEALNNTLIFDKAEDIDIDKEFKIPKIVDGDSNEILKDILQDAWDKEKVNIKPEKHEIYKKAIQDEFETVKECGMADYFILDHKIIDKAVNEYNAILTRSGRGSAVSFYITKLLGLTEVDRIKSPITLYPSRFLTSARVLETKSLPDIDLNFADVTPVIKASKDILGEDGIYYMVAYKPLQESSAFRLWCKANDLEIDEYNEIAKNLDNYVNDKKWEKLIEDSKIFRGVIESVSPSPCSFLLSDKSISKEVGLIKVGDEICCCLDGYNCDVYKYLKNDYLTVQVYSIISEVYKLLGRPIDNISTLINNCDDKVWDIYANGITTAINQADSDFGKQTVKRYKPTSLAELSGWVASIRPGFASLMNDFLDRKPYTTGVEELDDLLKESSHRMLYQESIMKYLIWLGIDEKDSYDVIKKIAKKKFKEEELQQLKLRLIDGWKQHVGKPDGFEETWQVIEDAVKYSFNASHSISVAIDSIYGAYLKSHYPLEFMTVALNLYANDETRTNNLIEECSLFDIKIKSPKFRYSKGEYFMDKKTNTIYKGIGSIKYLNSQIGNELYNLKDNVYNSFLECLIDVKTNININTKQLDYLIKIGYFSEFGTIKNLLYITDLYYKLYNKKSLSLDKLEELGLNLDQAIKYGRKTEKKIMDLDYEKLLNDLINNIPNEEFPLVELLKMQKDILGYIDYVNPELDKKICLVNTFDGKYNTKKVNLYCLNNGKTVDFKLYNKIYKHKPIEEGDIIYTSSMERKPKPILLGEDENGKKQWGKDMNNFEWVLNDYNILKEI